MIYALATSREWNEHLLDKLNKESKNNWILINKKEQLTASFLKQKGVSRVFIPHWSHIIEPEVWTDYECIVFHMTDLPFGRGGSPLQNLITRGFKETKVTAIRVDKGIDTGDVYLKRNLNLEGSALEIFNRFSNVVLDMITTILATSPSPVPQNGESTIFKRRTPEMSEINSQLSPDQLYDHIRMLDAPGYPKAYIDFGDYRIEFDQANLKSATTINANVRIIKK